MVGIGARCCGDGGTDKFEVWSAFRSPPSSMILIWMLAVGRGRSERQPAVAIGLRTCERLVPTH